MNEKTESGNDNPKKWPVVCDAILLFFISIGLSWVFFYYFTINANFWDIYFVDYRLPFISIMGSIFIVILIDLNYDRFYIFPVCEYKYNPDKISKLLAVFYFMVFVAALLVAHYKFYYDQINSKNVDGIYNNYSYMRDELAKITDNVPAPPFNAVKSVISHYINLFRANDASYFKATFYFYPFINQDQSENNIRRYLLKNINSYESDALIATPEVLEVSINLWILYKKHFLSKELLPILAPYWNRKNISAQNNIILWQITALETLKMYAAQSKTVADKIQSLYSSLLTKITGFLSTGKTDDIITAVLLAHVLLSVDEEHFQQAMEDKAVFSVVNINLLENKDFKNYLKACSKENVNCQKLASYI